MAKALEMDAIISITETFSSSCATACLSSTS